jgi:hypothetical protein
LWSSACAKDEACTKLSIFMQLGSGPHCGGSSRGNLIVRNQRLSAASHVANIAGASRRFLF